MNLSRSGSVLVLACLLACSSSSSSGPKGGGSSGGGSGSGSGGGGTGQVGASCTPSSESSASFDGFNAAEISADTSNAACAGACLVNHFQGLTTCPYGQSAQAVAPSGAMACTVPGTSTPVAGAVLPQCTDRAAADTVYCSCQCADSSGNAGSSDCTCPSDYDCTSLGGTLGSYCLKDGTTYDPNNSCGATCDPQASPCQ
jgi:hypothetical protein